MTRSTRGRSRWLVVPGIVGALVAGGVLVSSAVGYDRYNDGCQNCHGEFTDGTSPTGTVFPDDNKHTMHRSNSWMNTECDLCHTDGDGRDPFIGSSNGTANNPGVGCTGCHGRDYGGDIGNSGVGLRAHHFINGIENCAGCHPDDPAPLIESVVPTYYGTVDTNADDPCNAGPDFLENWSLDEPVRGLDNDGNNLYDGDDPACAGGIEGDANGDGCVDFADILVVLGEWGQMGEDLPGDTNGDMVVDFADILVILAAWGNGCG